LATFISVPTKLLVFSDLVDVIADLVLLDLVDVIADLVLLDLVDVIVDLVIYIFLINGTDFSFNYVNNC
jgi:hypothetical protein